MKISYLFLIFPFLVFPSFQYNTESYDIENIYEEQSVDSGTLAKTSFGAIEEIEKIYLETEIDVGKYSITVTREDDNFYRIGVSDIFIQTRYCYEYSYSQDAILVIDSNYGYSKGQIIFID